MKNCKEELESVVKEHLESSLDNITTTLAATSTLTSSLAERVASLERLVACLYAAK